LRTATRGVAGSGTKDGVLVLEITETSDGLTSTPARLAKAKRWSPAWPFRAGCVVGGLPVRLVASLLRRGALALLGLGGTSLLAGSRRRRRA
jgi:hypothetical protein